MAEHRSTKLLPLADEGIGDTNTVSLRIVDDIDLFCTLRIKVVSSRWPLMVIRRRNAEIADLIGGAQGRQQIVLPAAARCICIFSQTGIGVRRANLSDGSLV